MTRKTISENIKIKNEPNIIGEYICINEFINRLIAIENKCLEKGYTDIKIEIDSGYDGAWTNIQGNRQETEQEMERRIIEEDKKITKIKDKELKEFEKAKETYERLRKKFEND